MSLPRWLTSWVCDDPSPRYSALDQMDGRGDPRFPDQSKGGSGLGRSANPTSRAVDQAGSR